MNTKEKLVIQNSRRQPQSSVTVRDGGGTTRPLPRDGGAEELRGDPTVGPHPKVWTKDRE